MQDVPIKAFLIGVIFSSILWIMVVIAFNFETKIPETAIEDHRFELHEAAVTENRRLYDAESDRTVLWVPGNPKISVVGVKKLSNEQWQVVVEAID